MSCGCVTVGGHYQSHHGLSVQMVWESGCVVIVMLTPLSENGVRQCYHYWPDEGSNLYHVYEVLHRGACPRPLPPVAAPCGQVPTGSREAGLQASPGPVVRAARPSQELAHCDCGVNRMVLVSEGL